MTDQLKKYLFPDHGTRVQAVRLTGAWQTGLAHQSHPACVVTLLGELVSAATLLASNIKFDGSVILQLQGDGPVALMVVECTADLSIRATATLREGHAPPKTGTLQSLLNHNETGRFTVILDPGASKKGVDGMKPYQGVVPLDGDTISDVLQAYMKNSEQLDTRLWLAADATQSAGLLIQRLPDPHEPAATRGETGDGWERACHLAGTVKHNELLTLESDALIHRLFWQEALLAYEPLPLRWHCPCTRARVAEMLRMLGRNEIDDILKERGHIDISCNFCGKPYAFDAVDCARLFIDSADPARSGSESIH